MKHPNWSYMRRLLSPAFHRQSRMLSKAVFKSKEECLARQLVQLREVLVYAYEHVPYYRDSFRKAGVDPHRLKRIEDFSDYPILTREEYRANLGAFIDPRVRPSSVYRRLTGGTTGQPLPFPRQIKDDARELAYTFHVYRLLGVNPFTRKLLLRGPVDDFRGRFVRYEELGNALRLSTSNMTDSNLGEYVRLIRNFRPRLIYAVPSSLAILCNYLERQRLPAFESVRWILTQSEMLYEFQEHLIERVLGVPVFTSYGQAEHVVSAWRCKESKHFHVLPQYGYAELLDECGKPVETEGQPGRVVGTCLEVRCSPLIRYDTGDRAIHAGRACPCGTPYPSWLGIEGRRMSVVYTKHGGHACLGPMLLCHMYEETHRTIRRFGIEQFREGELVITVVPTNPGAAASASRCLSKAIHEEYPGLFDIRIVVEESPPPSKADKHLFLRQHVRKDELTRH